MFPDDFPNLFPLRAIALQSLFLVVAIAIEATVLQQRMPADNPDKRHQITPKDSVYFAATMNLLCVILGWIALFTLFNLADILPPGVQVPLVSFIFFDQWSGQTATLLIVAGFILFFASLGIKLLALIGLRQLLEFDKKEEKKEDKPEDAPAEPAPRLNFFRELREEPNELRSEITTVLFANAWSYSAILAALVIRQALIHQTIL